MDPFPASVMHLIALLRDGEKGFRELSEQVDGLKCRLHLVEESFTRATFAEQLEQLLDRLQPRVGRPPDAAAGTLPGTVHRRWIDLRAAWGADDWDLLQMLNVCEATAAAAYAEILDDPNLAPALRTLLQVQFNHVQKSPHLLRNLCFGRQLSSGPHQEPPSQPAS